VDRHRLQGKNAFGQQSGGHADERNHGEKAEDKGGHETISDFV
jgi:hypothetical protein